MNRPAATDEGSLLLTLEQISQLVSHSHNPAETLSNIVRLIQSLFHTAVCSVYLLETERGELVLGATVGLKPESKFAHSGSSSMTNTWERLKVVQVPPTLVGKVR